MPGSAHCFAWVIGTLFEIVTVAILSSVQPSIRVSAEFIFILNVLALVRVVTLIIMITIMCLGKYLSRRSESKASAEERQSLLQGNGASASYGGTQAPALAVPPVRRTQVSGTGWLDYFAGFRVLFPYLWCVTQLWKLELKVDTS